MAIVKVNYLPTGRRGETRRLGRAVAYYSWREDGHEHPRKQPRTWYRADGRLLDYGAARQEITAQARQAPYTYRVVLSTRWDPLTPAAYAAVLHRQFERYYLVLHHGGEHPHAHVVAFSERRLERDDLQELREALGQRELLKALHLAPDLDQEPIRPRPGQERDDRQAQRARAALQPCR